MAVNEQLTVKVFIVEDHELMRVALREALASESWIKVVGEAATVAEAARRIPMIGPDVALLDLRLPDGNGIELCREVKSRLETVRCLIVTQHSDEEALMDSVIAGAAGYVTKDIPIDQLIDAVRRVAAGESLLSAESVQAAMKRLQAAAGRDDKTSDLTAKESEVLTLIGEGLSNREIAGRLFLAEQTVKNYVSRILAKLGMKGRTELALFSARISDQRRRFLT